MTFRNQDFTLCRGESTTIFIDFQQDDDLLSATDFKWWAAKSAYSLSADNDVLIKKSLGSGVTLASGGVNLDLETTDTQDLEPNFYYHELKAYLAGGGISSACIGTMVVKPALDMR